MRCSVTVPSSIGHDSAYKFRKFLSAIICCTTARLPIIETLLCRAKNCGVIELVTLELLTADNAFRHSRSEL